jgi:transposase
MKEVFGVMPRSRIALETGMHSPWVSRVLNELGHEVIVAHASNVRLIGKVELRQLDRVSASQRLFQDVGRVLAVERESDRLTSKE